MLNKNNFHNTHILHEWKPVCVSTCVQKIDKILILCHVLFYLSISRRIFQKICDLPCTKLFSIFFVDIRSETCLTVRIQARALRCHILVSLSPRSRNLCALISRGARGQASSCRYRNSAIFGDARKRWKFVPWALLTFLSKEKAYRTGTPKATPLDCKRKESK